MIGIRRYNALLLFAALLSIMILAASCSFGNDLPSTTTALLPTLAPTASPTPSPDTQAGQMDSIQAKLDRMSIEDKIGQMVIIGLEGTSLKKRTREMLDEYRVGGFILYKRNIDKAEQTMALLNELKAANSSDIPLWLSVDEEGGLVTRIPKEFDKLPTPREIGKSEDIEYSYELGSAIGGALRSLGFNMNYAPVLDIDSNPDNPVIGSRSFGRDARTVSDFGIASMQGLQSQGIVSVVKHFPGHGDTSVDSHLDLPVEDKTKSELDSFELQPFKAAIKSGTDAIMVAHILLPHIDEQQPASLSAKLINGLLRDELGYDGVVMTDDMTMGGITKHRDIGDAAVESVLAGTDILLVGHHEKLQADVLETLRDSVANGEISEKRLDESVYRILQLKEKYKLQDAPNMELDVDLVNEHIQDALKSQP